MTNKDLKRRVKELIRQSLNAKRVDEMVNKVIASGCLDVEGAQETYRLPKQIVCAISKQLYFDYQPLYDDAKQKREIKNIYRHI